MPRLKLGPLCLLPTEQTGDGLPSTIRARNSSGNQNLRLFKDSVARMQQGRHRRMAQGLLDLKRLYWNCRAFRTGRRRGQTPYALLGLRLPTDDWWELLQLPPEQLRLALAEPGLPATPPTELSAPTVAA
jgi:hypothetical protein